MQCGTHQTHVALSRQQDFPQDPICQAQDEMPFVILAKSSPPFWSQLMFLLSYNFCWIFIEFIMNYVQGAPSSLLKGCLTFFIILFYIVSKFPYKSPSNICKFVEMLFSYIQLFYNLCLIKHIYANISWKLWELLFFTNSVFKNTVACHIIQSMYMKVRQ
jgi:hypothetical protein